MAATIQFQPFYRLATITILAAASRVFRAFGLDLNFALCDLELSLVYSRPSFSMVASND